MRTMKHWALAAAAAAALALAGCGGGGGSSSSAPPAGPTAAEMLAERQMEQRNAISTAVMAANEATEGLSGDSTEADLMAADSAVMAANSAIAAGTDLPSSETAANSATVAAYADRIASARMAIADAAEEAEEAAEMAMMATAMKLHMGISAPVGDGTGNDDRFAAYTGTNDSQISVTIGTGDAAGTAVPLSEDKKTMVDDNHGWEGKRYAASGTGVDGTYEAMVYSNVGDPKMGAKFNGGASGDGAVGFALDSGTTDTVTMTAELNQSDRIASPRFTHTAGTHTFELPKNDPSGATMIPIPGSYYGVEGTYACTPETGACGVNKTEDGYEFANPAAWTFKAADPNARVTEMPDMFYASYGWWLHKGENGTWTASAFVDDKDNGTVTNVPAATGIRALQGTATYMGGAAGKYALYSATGGTNDAGHFTARAMLEADFNTDMISGTIDNFMGADGMVRDWSVELMKQTITDTGFINGTGGAGASETKWTIGETAGAAGGQWSGSLQDNGDDNVPKVGTGTFHSTYGSGNSMVGAFGVNVQ